LILANGEKFGVGRKGIYAYYVEYMS